MSKAFGRMKQGLRYSPPRVEVPAEVDWLLLRSLGAPEAPWTREEPLQADGLSSIIGGIDLLARARSRCSRERLATEGNGVLLEPADTAAHRIAAVEALHEEVSRRLVRTALGLRAPVILLKGMALRAGGYSAAGTRMAGDIDVLVPRQMAEIVSQALVRDGYRRLDYPEKQHHLRPLADPLGAVIEIHLEMRGVRIAANGDATVEDCLRLELCQEVNDWPDGTYIPNPDLLMAHVLVHGLGQHGLSPGSYPLLQLLADLQDLGFTGSRGDEFLSSGYGWIQDMVSSDELDGIRGLLKRLEQGERASDLVDQEGLPGLMLRHLIAGSTDREYRQSMKLSAVAHAAGEAGSVLELAQGLGRALVPTRGQIDLIYGRPMSGWGYLGRRLWRPFDLVSRALRSLWVRRSLKSRR